VPLDAIVEESLKEYIEVRKSEIAELFVSKKGGALTPRAIQYMVKKYAKEANLI
jgi:site-specific recombinase XerD